MSRPGSVFISYSWDSAPHKAWCRDLAARLRADGVRVKIDQWSTAPGDQLPEFMERAIRESAFVVIVCTPHYKGRSEARMGGVGYEGHIITAELREKGNQRKFIPVLRAGTWSEAAPSWLAGKYFVDLREGPSYEENYTDLLTTLLGSRDTPPPLGAQRQTHASTTDSEAKAASVAPGSSDPVEIVGVAVDEVTEPRDDGTAGSALYRVPFRLSRPVSGTWASIFAEVWDSPPEFTLMHRYGDVEVYGDRIVLTRTTIDEVQEYHRRTLELCVRETNRRMSDIEATKKMQRAKETARSEAHHAHVREVAQKIEFGE